MPVSVNSNGPQIGKLQMYCQPQYCLHSGRISDIELLTRYVTANGTVTAPGRFLSFMRKSDKRQTFIEWVINQAIFNSKILRANGFLGRVAINADGQDITPETVSFIRRRLKDNPSIDNLEVELTEHVSSEHNESLQAELENLRKLGVSIAIDDYGKGSNCLQTLLTCPFDKIKLDKSMLVAESETKEAVIRSTIAMANQLRKKLVVEGVETRSMAEKLKEWGVRNVQGYLYGTPMPVNVVNDLILSEGEPYAG